VHVRTACVLGPCRACAAAALLLLARHHARPQLHSHARQYREPRACSSAATPVLFCSRAATPRAPLQHCLARVLLTRLRHASHAPARAPGRQPLALALRHPCACACACAARPPAAPLAPLQRDCHLWSAPVPAEPRALRPSPVLPAPAWSRAYAACPRSARSPEPRAPAACSGQKRERERDTREDKTEREEEQRRKRNRTSQGLVHKFRKLQGPLGKVKFLINLKP
jgi:hypothetical protein